MIFEDIEGTLTRIGIRFDVYYNERSLYDEGKLEEALADLRAAGLVYDCRRRGLVQGDGSGPRPGSRRDQEQR